MIAKLRGRVDSVAETSVILDVGGVGYLVFCSSRTLGALPAIGEAAELLVLTHVREDHIHLYGFIDAAERDWFSLLQGVQGVGARVALGVLSAIGAQELMRAIATQDSRLLTKAPSVGPKLAGRIVSELKDKVGAVALPPRPAAGGAPSGPGAATHDAVSALVNLGYRQNEALSAVEAVARDLGPGADLSSLIRGGLKELGR